MLRPTPTQSKPDIFVCPRMIVRYLCVTLFVTVRYRISEKIKKCVTISIVRYHCALLLDMFVTVRYLVRYRHGVMK